ERRVVSSTQHTHPVVREFAVKYSTEHFSEDFYKKYGKMVRYFSLYKHIRQNWRYVNDPRGLDYYSPATESIRLMAGDCDDYSILMASSIMAIGGEARVIITQGHMYTEVKVGTEEELDKISYCVRLLFPDESEGKNIYYHQTGDDIWINFDYTEEYPGGRFMSPEIIEMITLR
ncbi:MAG: transglutaminase-like domain-containing protein, partial [Hymenobacteraceae bacterium]|nr:transglutaminase-like domain-containing protein [Hymenobacteraceae bacterium]MDX5397318.1 transglutaminase-like domain-containing protein [Hymenobacteraceae bacterium]MDX5513396.1 transglutaminase-like domain-containing protein [Hymenobacteraceae bacterium]